MTDASAGESSMAARASRRLRAAPRAALLAAVLLAAVVLAAAGPAPVAQSAPVPHDPLVAAAGDIACSPADAAFNGGAGDERHCAQMRTSDVVIGLHPDSVLMLGDAQYNAGHLEDFAGSYDPSWGRFKSITHPVIGNHEYFGAGVGYFDYFNGPGVFSGPAGDRDKGYYSYDVGDWHLVALNSVCSRIGGCGPGSPELDWLRADLAAHPGACTLAYWHHPLFTSSDVGWTSVGPLYEALYDAGADVVLNGHAHEYERFAPQDPNGVADPAFGVREFVVGTGGKSLNPGPLVPGRNAEVVDTSTFGVLALTLHAGSYDWRFADAAGGTFADSGSTACHGAPPPRPPVTATGSAIATGRTTARLNAAVDPRDQATSYRFEYGPSPAYGLSTAEIPVGSTNAGRQEVAARIDGLVTGRTYHYRVIATNPSGAVVGADRTFAAGVRSPYQRTIEGTHGLIAYWRMGDAGSGLAFDDHGLNLGVEAGAPPSSRRGAPVTDQDAAAAFGGTNSVQAGGPTVTNAATIEGWFRWTGGNVIMRDDSATGGWILARNANGRLGYRVSGRSYRTRRPIDSVRDGAWHHLALTKDGESVAFYVDGLRVHSAGGARSAPPTMPWSIMRNGPFEDHATGTADEIAIFDRALPAATIARHYSSAVRDSLPSTTLQAPSGATNNPRPTLRFRSDKRGTRFRCTFGAVGQPAPAFAPCAAALRPGRLADGSYRVQAYGVAKGYAEPRPVARTFTVDTVVPTLSLTVGPAALPRALRSGVRATVSCSESCDVTARLTVRGAAAKRLHSRKGAPVMIGQAIRRVRAGAPSVLVVRVSPATRKALAGVRPLAVTLRVTAADAAGNARTARRVLR